MHGKFLIDFFGEFLAFFGGAIFGFDVEGNIGPVSGNIGPVS